MALVETGPWWRRHLLSSYYIGGESVVQGAHSCCTQRNFTNFVLLSSVFGQFLSGTRVKRAVACARLKYG